MPKGRLGSRLCENARVGYTSSTDGGGFMKRFVEGEDRRQATLLPDSLEDYVTEDNPVRVVEVFIDELDLAALGLGVS